jgi:hypothetical protein
MSKDRTKPCSECPFSKRNVLTKEKALGGAKPTVYIGQAMGPFLLPCHMDKNYKDKQTDYRVASACAGAATFRHNIGVDIYMPAGINILPIDKELVFGSREEFLAHYLEVDIDTIRATITERDYADMFMTEVNEIGVKIHQLPLQ